MKFYQLVSDKWRGFFTGCSGDRQLLIGFHLPGLLALVFDAQGVLVSVQHRVFSDDLLREWENPPYDPHDPTKELRVNGLEELRKLQQETGFVEGPIRVQPFAVETDHGIYLTEFPEEYRDVLDDPNQFEDEEEYEEAHDHIRKWSEAGMFAFGWDVEYYMNSDGTINTI